METTTNRSGQAPAIANPVRLADQLQVQHNQLRQQLVEAILQQAVLCSLGAGWSTVLVPVESVQPLKLTRNFGRPVLRALYINDPITQSDDVFNLVLQFEGGPDFTGAYRIEPGQHGQSQLFSTDALLTLLSVLEEGDLQVVHEASTY